MPLNSAARGFRVRIESQLARVGARAGHRIVIAVNPVAIQLTRADFRQERVPDVGIHLTRFDLRFGSVFIGETEHNAGGGLTEQ